VSNGGADSEFQSVLFEQPYCRVTTIVDRLFINREFLQLLVRGEPAEGADAV
jgi:hypothetical protein